MGICGMWERAIKENPWIRGLCHGVRRSSIYNRKAGAEVKSVTSLWLCHT